MSLPINPTSAQVAALTTTQVAALTLGELRYTVAETGEAVMSALAPKQVVALRQVVSSQGENRLRLHLGQANKTGLAKTANRLRPTKYLFAHFAERDR
jgi:hypothetical protein